MNAPRGLMFVVNNAAFFESHRLPIAQAAARRGWQVLLCTGHEASATLAGHALPRLASAGIEHRRVAFHSAGINPLRELLGIAQLVCQMRQQRPAIVHCASPKGVLYGALAARIAGVPALVLAVSGVGFAFTRGHQSPLRRVARWAASALSALAWGHANKRVIVQNHDDLREVCERGLARREEVLLLPGSGIELERFTGLPIEGREDLVLLPARLLLDKGVHEFAEAARQLRAALPHWRCVLVGTADYANPSAVPREQIEAWQREGVLQWWGHRDDMPALYGRARIVCLPSYREGLPRSLLEAAAAGCAVITSDAPGCREAIEPGITGELVPPRDGAALARALIALCGDAGRIRACGQAGRERARRLYSLDAVVDRTLTLYGEIVDARDR